MRMDELLNYYYDEMSDNEKYVCHYLAGHYEECSRKTVEEFAADCNVSKPLLIRFAKKLGLSGYSELKAQIRIERRESEPDAEGLLQAMTDGCHKMMEDLVKKNLTSLFEKIFLADRVFVYGSGSSQARAASEMKRIFLPAKEMIHLHGHDLLCTLKKIAQPQDLVIIISLSGESEHVAELAKALKVSNVPAVSITRLRSNTLASLCQENLYIHSIRIPVKYDMEYETSTPYFILIEYLYLSYQNYLAQKTHEPESVQKSQNRKNV